MVGRKGSGESTVKNQSYHLHRIPILVIISLATLLSLWATIGLDAMNLHVPVVRPVAGFLSMTLVPGMLALTLLGINTRSLAEWLLWSIGLSLAMAIGAMFALNEILPFLGESKPISELSVAGALTVSILVMSMTLIRLHPLPKEMHEPVPRLYWLVDRELMYCALLPISSVVGTSLLNTSQSNIVSLLTIAGIAAVPLLVSLDKFAEKYFAIAVFSIALALVWQRSLLSGYLVGADIHAEYYFQNLVLANSYWNPSISSSSVNSMLSVTLLIPGYSLVLNLDSIWIFKIVYPALFAFVPVVLYQVFKTQTTGKVAFLACFFFMATNVFFSDMPLLTRQGIAELFLALCALALLSPDISPGKSRYLLIVFGLSIIVSHYGLAYIFAFYLVTAYLYVRIRHQQKSAGKTQTRQAWLERVLGMQHAATADRWVSAVPGFLALFLVFLFGWYVYTAGSSAFISIVRLGDRVSAGVYDIFNPETRDPSVLLAVGITAGSVASVLGRIFLALQYLVQLFIIVGVARAVLQRKETSWNPLFVGMAVSSTALLLLSIVLPYFSAALTMERLYHITLFFLAPFFITGGITVIQTVARAPRRLLDHWAGTNGSRTLGVAVVVVLVPYFLFGTGFVAAVGPGPAPSPSLDPTMDYPRFNLQEVIASDWLVGHASSSPYQYADNYASGLLSENAFGRVIPLWGDTTNVVPGSYVFLRCINVDEQLIMQSYVNRTTYSALPTSPLFLQVISQQSLVYSNGCAEVYF